MRKRTDMTILETMFFYGLGLFASTKIDINSFGLNIPLLLLAAYLLSIENIVKYLKESNFKKHSKVVVIEDCEFIVEHKQIYHHRRSKRIDPTLKVRHLSNKSISTTLKSETMYDIYNVGDEITLQLVIYRFKNRYIYDFKRAEKSEYKELKSITQEDLNDYELNGKSLLEKEFNK